MDGRGAGCGQDDRPAVDAVVEERDETGVVAACRESDCVVGVVG